MDRDWLEKARHQDLERELNGKELTDDQKKALRRLDEANYNRRASLGTRLSHLRWARRLSAFAGKPIDQITREDLEQYIEHVGKTNNEQSMTTVRSTIRRIYTVLASPPTSEPPEEVAWIRVPAARGKNLVEVLSRNEVNRMVAASGHPMDQALVMLLYETGAESAEFCRLRIADVDVKSANVTLTGGQGMRTLVLSHSIPYLERWLAHHPNKDQPDAPLFGLLNWKAFHPLTWPGLRRALRQIAREAGLPRRIRSDLFRRSRLIELAAKLSPEELAAFAGWKPYSRAVWYYKALNKTAGDAGLQ